MSFPELPPRTEEAFRAAGLASVFEFFRDKLKNFFNNAFHTLGDVTCKTAAKGVIMTNSLGITKRARLNDAGNGWIFEDP